MAFANIAKSSAPTWLDASKNSSSFTNLSRSLRTFGDLTIDEIESLTFEGILNGKAVGDWTFDELIGQIWTNQVKST